MGGRDKDEDWATYQFTGEDMTAFLNLAGGSGLKLSKDLQTPGTEFYSFSHIQGVGKKANIRAGTQSAHIVNYVTLRDTVTYYLNWMDISTGGSGSPLMRMDNHLVFGLHKGDIGATCDGVSSGPVAVRTFDILNAIDNNQMNLGTGITAAIVATVRADIFA